MPTTTPVEVYLQVFAAQAMFVAGASLALAFGHRLCHGAPPRPFPQLWRASWLAYLLARILTAVQMWSPGLALGTAKDLALSAASQAGYYLHIVFLLLCVRMLVRRDDPAPGRRRLVATVVGVFAATLVIASATAAAADPLRMTLRVGLRCSLTAVAYLLAGTALLRHGLLIQRPGAQVVGFALWTGVVANALHAIVFCTGIWYPIVIYTGMFEILELAAVGIGLVLWGQQDAAAEARHANAELAERTASLLRAQRLDSIGQLAGGVAHDFNNVLTVVLGNTEAVLREGQLEAAVRDKLVETSHAAAQAAKLTGQLLAIARNSGSSLHTIDVCRESRDLEPLLRSLAGPNVAVAITTSTEPLRVLLKRGHLEQILINLVTNGRDAIAGAGTIAVRVGREIAGGTAYVALSATDSGIGMSEDVRGRVGELFFTSKAGRGTGLGMASVRSILAETQGDLAIASSPGKGTTVTLRWLEVERPADGDTPLPTVVLPRPGSATILFAEDDAMVRAVTRRTLETAGYHVLTADSAAEALQLALQHPGRIDLLLADVVMPGLSGPQLAEEIRGARPDLPVCYVSGYIDDLHDAQLTVDVPVLGKPFTRQELLAFVQAGLAHAARDTSPTQR